MIETQVRNIIQPSDLNQLLQIMNGLIGETCWKAKLSYGDELTLHIGEKIPYSQKSMAGKEKGAWILGTRATQWQLNCLDKVVVSSEDDPELIKNKISIIKENTITNVQISYPNLILTVSFENKCDLILFPNKEDVDLPYWEVFTPDQMVIKVGPGITWSIKSSKTKINS
jgi:hypothetical protein